MIYLFFSVPKWVVANDNYFLPVIQSERPLGSATEWSTESKVTGFKKSRSLQLEVINNSNQPFEFFGSIINLN